MGNILMSLQRGQKWKISGIDSMELMCAVQTSQIDFLKDFSPLFTALC